MKKYLLLICFFASLSFNLHASAQETNIPNDTNHAGVSKPVMIIRFTQGNVLYEQPLLTVINKAKQIKDKPFFKVLSLYNVNNSKEEIAKKLAKKFVTFIHQNGIESEYIYIEIKKSSKVVNNEIQLFVE